MKKKKLILNFIKFIIKFFQLLLVTSFALGLCFLFSLLFNFWADYGYLPDTLFHYELAHYVSQYFPHIDWVYRWACGTPFFLIYPKALYLMEAGFRYLTHLDMQLIAFGAIFSGIFLASVWTILAIKVATGSWLLGLSFAPFYYGTGLLWENRNFSRGASYHFLSLAVLFLVWYLKKPSKKRKIILILALAACSLIHPIIGLMILATAACFLLKKSFSVLIPVLLIAFSYYLPLKLYSGSHSRFFRGYEHLHSFIISLKELSYIHASPFALPLVLLLLIIFILFARKKINHYQTAILRGAILTSLGFLIYFFGVFFHLPPFIYITGLPHWVVSIYLPPFLALIGAISLKNLTKNYPRAISWITTALLFYLIIFLNFQPLKDKIFNPILAKPVYKIANWSDLENLFGSPPGENDYRFIYSHPDPVLPNLFNIRYDTPNFGIQHHSSNIGEQWYRRAMDAFGQAGKEKLFYADWYGLHYLFPLTGLKPDLAENSNIITIKNYDQEGRPFGGYFNNPKPILEANSSPNIILIGQDYTYDDRINVLTQTNINSSFLIPVRGPKSLAKISFKELAKFDVVWLYGYDYGIKWVDLNKLERFVKQGGGLVVDTGFSPDSEVKNLPNPFPIVNTHIFSVKEKWQIEKEDHPINQDINFEKFSPPVYSQDQPWKVSATNPENIKNWAKAILSVQGKPIVVTGQLEEGSIIWIGFNLPYHLTQFKNEEESLFIKNMLLWVTKDKIEKQTQFEAKFINPEKREVIVNSPAKGIIFREQFFPNWKAKVDQKRQKIYRAGPDLMYLPFAKNQSFPIKVTFYYQKGIIETGTAIIAVATVIILLIAFFKKDFLNKFLKLKKLSLKS